MSDVLNHKCVICGKKANAMYMVENIAFCKEHHVMENIDKYIKKNENKSELKMVAESVLMNSIFSVLQASADKTNEEKSVAIFTYIFRSGEFNEIIETVLKNEVR